MNLDVSMLPLSERHDLLPIGNVSWRSPSNLAIVKYWGKHGMQLPRNPSISFTLRHAFTETTMSYRAKTAQEQTERISLTFRFEGVENEVFRAKQLKFLHTLIPTFPFLTEWHFHIESHNSFPHSAGIASSASSMSALALCLCELEMQLQQQLDSNFLTTDFYQKASYIARLGSGSACRSVYPKMAVWGKFEEVSDASDLYAVPFVEPLHTVFHTFHDDILMVSKGEKSVSSRMGHGLMDNNPYAAARYSQAKIRMTDVVRALKSGDVAAFGQVAEDEALTSHALMMTSSPSFTLLRPNSLRMVELLRGWRMERHIPAYFSFDAGPNLHLLYPDEYTATVQEFVRHELEPLCENRAWLADVVGDGATRLA